MLEYQSSLDAIEELCLPVEAEIVANGLSWLNDKYNLI